MQGHLIPGALLRREVAWMWLARDRFDDVFPRGGQPLDE